VLQVEIVVQGKEEVKGAGAVISSALTKTGITAPVLNPKDWWPRTTSHISIQSFSNSNRQVLEKSEGLASQNRSNFSRVTRNRDPSAIITPKYIINHLLTPNILISRHLTLKWFPKQIILRKPSLNLIARESIMDISLSSSSITSVATNAFTEKLLHCRNKRLSGWEIKSGESDIGCL
jgi:hypothetical protein